MGLFDDFFKVVQKGVNSSVGNYRDVYFRHYPERFHICKGCGTQLDREVSHEVTIDHIVPQKCNGTNAITNLQVLCRSCNSRKKDAINSLTLKYSGEALLRELRNMIGY